MSAPESPLSLSLDAISNGMPGLTAASGKHLAECAAVCLEDRQHNVGVVLQVSAEEPALFSLNWEAVTDQQRHCYNDMQEATEKGACGLSILLMRELTGLVVVERSKKGTGFDYWLGEADDDTLFSGKVRLEVSGLLEASDSQCKTRIKQKMAQLSPSDGSAPGYVGIVEFSRPKAHVELKKVV